MKLKKIECTDLDGINDLKLSIKSDKNLLLLKERSYGCPTNIFSNFCVKLKKSSKFYSNKDIGVFSITLEDDESTIQYAITVNDIGENIHESLYINNSLECFLDHIEPSNSIIKKSLEHQLCYPNLFYTDRTLINLVKNLYITNYEEYSLQLDRESLKIAEEFIINAGLGIKKVLPDFYNVITDQGFNIGINNIGSGAKMLLSYLPKLINSIIKGGCSIFINTDICSAFHPHLLKIFLELINNLSIKYNSQVIIPWYGCNEDFLISTEVIKKENIVLLTRETENLIIE